MRNCVLCRSDAECSNCVRIYMLDLEFGRSVRVRDRFSGVCFILHSDLMVSERNLCCLLRLKTTWL